MLKVAVGIVLGYLFFACNGDVWGKKAFLDTGARDSVVNQLKEIK